MAKQPKDGASSQRPIRGYLRFSLWAAGYDLEKLDDPATRLDELKRVARKHWSLKAQLRFWLLSLAGAVALIMLGVLLNTLGWD